MTLVTRLCVILADTLVLGLTWWKALPLREADSILNIVLRDGKSVLPSLVVLCMTSMVHRDSILYVTTRGFLSCCITDALARRTLLLMNVAQIILALTVSLKDV